MCQLTITWLAITERRGMLSLTHCSAQTSGITFSGTEEACYRRQLRQILQSSAAPLACLGLALQRSARGQTC